MNQQQADELTRGVLATAAQLVAHATNEILAGFVRTVEHDAHVPKESQVFGDELRTAILKEAARRLEGGERIPLPSKS